MLKEHIHDLFTEGLGDIFFMKYYNFINKNVKNKTVRIVLIEIHKVFFLIFLILVAYIMFKLSWSL